MRVDSQFDKEQKCIEKLSNRISGKPHRIDKTAALKRAAEKFPALYIEGAAASGKSTAVELMVRRHPEIVHQVFWMDREAVRREILENLKLLLGQDETQSQAARWFIFENVPHEMSGELAQELADFVKEMPEQWKAVFISREQPPEVFLDLIWKRQMEIISQSELMFSPEEVQEMLEQAESSLQAEELYQITGGWAGCVDMMIRLAEKINPHPQNLNRSAHTDPELPHISVGELRKQYEIDTYIQREILDTLSEQEQIIVGLGALAPWINEDICREVCGVNSPYGILKNLERKGILVWLEGKRCWKTAPLFACRENQEFLKGISLRHGPDIAEASWSKKNPAEMKGAVYEKELESWYESHEFLKEALYCCRQFYDEEEYCACLLRHYEKIPFLGVSYTEILKYKDDSPKAAYLRGMCYRVLGNFRKMAQEAEDAGQKNSEIYLNLMFANPEVPLDEWMTLVQNLSKECGQRESRGKFRLFGILGYSHSYLCGIRDLSGMFACSKKEENKRANMWKKAFGEVEWRAYCLARIHFYLGTERGKALQEDDEELLLQITQPEFLHRIMSANEGWNYGAQERENGIAGLYLLCRLQVVRPDEERKNKIFQLAEALSHTEDIVCERNVKAIMAVFPNALGNPGNLGRWLLAYEKKEEADMTFTELIFRIRGYIMLHQYGKADRLLLRAIPRLKKYHQSIFYAEALFQQAIVNWHTEQHGNALKNVIDSFLTNASCRFVDFYTIYGNAGVEVLEAYIEWMQNNMPGGWKRKKKYNYGNVLRMPVEDYMDVVLRKAKRTAQKGNIPQISGEGESLTMMENIVLQAICQGLSNAEISEQQNLKITTVKSHIYNIYKKLGVKNRMQASLKGKEMGLV